jgi:hypothetical protein
MRIEFFEGRHRGKAFRANTDEVCAVMVVRCRNGWHLEIDRWCADLEMTADVLRAVSERWEKEIPLLKRRPRDMYCSGPPPADDLGCHTCMFVTIGWEMLDGWKVFLADILSRPESWRSWTGKKKADRALRRFTGEGVTIQ